MRKGIIPKSRDKLDWEFKGKDFAHNKEAEEDI